MSSALPHPISCLGAALLCLSATLPLSAQLRVTGRVLDEQTGSAVAGARVTLRNLEGRTLAERISDSTGAFELPVRVGLSARVQAERLGYHTGTTALLDLSEVAARNVELRLDEQPLPTDPLEVVTRGRASSPLLDGFFERSTSGFGHYITRSEIESRSPLHVSDLLAGVPGVRLESSGSGRRRIATMTRAGRRCRADIFLDGMHVTRWSGPAGAVSVDDVAAPSAVEGIEVYAGGGNVPAVFRSAALQCGVIAIWTRRGDVSEGQDGRGPSPEPLIEASGR